MCYAQFLEEDYDLTQSVKKTRTIRSNQFAKHPLHSKSRFVAFGSLL